MRIGSLFSGIGGLELGLEAAGVGHVVWQVEAAPFPRRVLARHWPDADRSVCDVRLAGAHNLAPVEVMCGGSPCVEVSSAGRKRGLVGLSALWYEFARIIRELRPRFIVVENVADLVSRGLTEVLGALASLGYDAEWSVLSACAVGAPHTRERVFIIAYANGHGEPACPLDGEMAWLPTPTRSLRNRWNSPPPVDRVDDGVPGGLDGTRALGRAVVPACARIVGLRLIDILVSIELGCQVSS